MAESLKPLSGLRVLDLSRLLPGPFLTRVLADLGADIIKVEPPEGDGARDLPPRLGDDGAAFAALNWGKRSVVIDLKQPLGVELLLALVTKADVLVESFRPGVLDRLGLDLERLCATRPELIVCSISGYGQEGPMREVAGHDLNYLARSGVLSLFGGPTVPGIQVADIGAGALMAAIGVLAALLERGQTGKGRHLDISMTRGMTSFLAVEQARRRAAPAEPRGQGLLTGGVPCYRVYETKDNQHMALAALEPKFFVAFCERAGCPHLAAKGLLLGEQGDGVVAELEQIFRSKTRDEWVALLAGVDCCCEPVRSIEEAMADPGIGAPLARTAAGQLLATHVGVPPDIPTRDGVPALGEHSLEVVRELGVDPDLVDRAVEQGVLGQA